MEKVYIVYEVNYGDPLSECDAVDIYGVFKDEDDAYSKAQELIDLNLHEGSNYVLDEERNDLHRDGFVRFFYNNQENWNDYFEIIVEMREVE